MIQTSEGAQADTLEPRTELRFLDPASTIAEIESLKKKEP